jgi:hypothetical protein
MKTSDNNIKDLKATHVPRYRGTSTSALKRLLQESKK